MKFRHKITTFCIGIFFLNIGFSDYVIDPKRDIVELKEYISNFKKNTLPPDPQLEPDTQWLSQGEQLWHKLFSNGQSYTSCFPNKKISGIKDEFPYFDDRRSEVITLAQSLNECREKNQESVLAWDSTPLLAVIYYLNQKGKNTTSKAPKFESKEALLTYQKGKHLYYGKRGQYNMSCADCHLYNAGKTFKGKRLSLISQQINLFPSKHEGANVLKSLHRQYQLCHTLVRLKPYPEQSPEYKALEIYQSYVSKSIN